MVGRVVNIKLHLRLEEGVQKNVRVDRDLQGESLDELLYIGLAQVSLWGCVTTTLMDYGCASWLVVHNLCSTPSAYTGSHQLTVNDVYRLNINGNRS